MCVEFFTSFLGRDPGLIIFFDPVSEAIFASLPHESVSIHVINFFLILLLIFFWSPGNNFFWSSYYFFLIPHPGSCCCWRYPKTKNSRGFSMFSTWRSAQFEHTFLVTEWGHPVPARFHEQSATEPNRETEDWCWGPHGACGDWPASWTKFKGKRVKKLAWDSLHSACDFDMIFPYFGFLVYFWYVQMISDVKMSKRCRMFGSFWMVPTMSYSRTCMPPYNPAPRLNWLPFHILSECLSAQNAALAVTGEAMFQRWRNLIVDRASTPKSLSFEKRSKVVIEKNMSCLAPLSKSKWLKHFYELLLKLRFHAGFQASNSLQRCIFSNGLPPRQ